MSEHEHMHEIVELVDRFQNWKGFDCPYCKVAALEARIRELEADVNEQARVNGMGGSREAALLAKVAKLEAWRFNVCERLGMSCAAGAEWTDLEVFKHVQWMLDRQSSLETTVCATLWQTPGHKLPLLQ